MFPAIEDMYLEAGTTVQFNYGYYDDNFDTAYYLVNRTIDPQYVYTLVKSLMVPDEYGAICEVNIGDLLDALVERAVLTPLERKIIYLGSEHYIWPEDNETV